jgi:hypothetical protein
MLTYQYVLPYHCIQGALTMSDLNAAEMPIDQLREKIKKTPKVAPKAKAARAPKKAVKAKKR